MLHTAGMPRLEATGGVTGLWKLSSVGYPAQPELSNEAAPDQLAEAEQHADVANMSTCCNL